MELKSKVLTVLIALAAAPALAGSPAAPKTPADRANAVAFKFYAAQAGTPGNLFFSPYSLQTAFSMAYEGAKGATAKEMAGVFAFQEPAKLRRAAEELRKGLEASAKGSEFTQANSFWAEETYKFLPVYTGLLTRYYGAEAKGANFKTAAELSRRAINAWTGEKTKGKITELFKEGALTPLTRLVLVNAVYFKGSWESPFVKKLTGPADFTRPDGTKVKAQMMAFSGTRSLQYGETGDFQVLRLPYAGGGLDMLVALPKDGKKLSEAAGGLSAAALDAMRKSLTEQKVKVFLPRFTFSSGFELEKTLSGLGMPLAFTDAADFSGMDGTKDLYIQKAVHKAFVEVNEEGTEAAAATGVGMGIKSMAFDFQLFRADRPFLFFIEDARSGLLLFMGRVEDPTAA